MAVQMQIFRVPIKKPYYLCRVIDQYSRYPVREVCTSKGCGQLQLMLENAMGSLRNVEILTSNGDLPYDDGVQEIYQENGVQAPLLL